MYILEKITPSTAHLCPTVDQLKGEANHTNHKQASLTSELLCLWQKGWFTIQRKERSSRPQALRSVRINYFCVQLRFTTPEDATTLMHRVVNQP